MSHHPSCSELVKCPAALIKVDLLLSSIRKFVCFAGGRDLASMKEFIHSQKVSLLQETEA